MSYVVDGIGEFHSLGAALRAAIVTDGPGSAPGLPHRALPPAHPAPLALPAASNFVGQVATAPVPAPAPDPASDPIKTVMWIGLGLLAAYAVYALVKSQEEE